MFIVKRFFCFKTKPSIPPHQSAITPIAPTKVKGKESVQRDSIIFLFFFLFVIVQSFSVIF